MGEAAGGCIWILFARSWVGLMAQIEWRYAFLYRRGSPSTPLNLLITSTIKSLSAATAAATEQDETDSLHPQNGADCGGSSHCELTQVHSSPWPRAAIAEQVAFGRGRGR